MSIISASRSVLIAFDELDRQLGHGRSVMVQHRDAYKALVAAVDVLRVAVEQEAEDNAEIVFAVRDGLRNMAEMARTLDGESAPEYVTK